jgi:phospholipid N-methyltransferase
MMKTSVQDDRKVFLKAMLREPRAVGAIAPSSQALAEQMIADVDWSAEMGILEYGPGTGPVTKLIQQRIADPSRYLGIETEDHFVKVLREHFSDLQFAHGSAENADDLARKAGLPPVGLIVSCLPFGSLPAPVQRGVLDATQRVLQPGGQFRTMQYVTAYGLSTARRFRRDMAQRFGPHHRSRVIVLNLPPAFVLSWQVPQKTD